ncbi:ATP-binding protein [Pseudoxanthomonas wuyuanensis]|uniref:histidine kinase n=1 Tax=Pseudoxanthomonas wuyuanensis TaxID=1073196 RepID=A0A286CVR6_9GAMM|nr:ATP-binding protein [Pseudoxanthomonas wuyuanensis]KAF1721296.1 sensor histidine kinase [Pseudoxanthomonas wuyuanensis]SOD50454.1 two-component system, sensor histidine kinase RegB [Pseudoxanthomonas wuyuanensis]
MPIVPGTSPSFLRTLCNLRWVAIVGQAVTVLVAVQLMRIPLPQAPLWGGIALLAAFNLYASWRSRYRPDDSPREAFAHMLVDVAVLAWLVSWSGGVGNPFSSMFLLLIVVAALALPLRWVLVTALACLLAYALTAAFGRPLPHVHGDSFNLHLWGMGVNFVLSAGVVLYFATRLVAALRQRERELAALRERFARDEGIVALATHAAAVAHELNTPLATMTLLAEDIGDHAASPDIREDAATMRQLIDLCRDRVRALAASADMGAHAGVDLDRVIQRWKLVRPTVELHRSGSLPPWLQVTPAVGHLLQALLNNAADASLRADSQRVDLDLRCEGDELLGEVRDYGSGFHDDMPFNPEALFRSSKPDGLGVGLALSHATVERLGGSLTMQAADPGVRMRFRLPLDIADEENE